MTKPVFTPEVNFICAICGIRAPQAILCTRDACPTGLLVHYAASPRKH